jgi:hypothetical protein
MRKLVVVTVPAVVLALAGAAAVSLASPARRAHANRRAALSATSPAHVLRANRQAAGSAADQLLAEVVLPAGATEVPTEPAGDDHQLDRANALTFFAAAVDRHRFWTTAASPRAVVASIEAHVPAGAKWSGSGCSGTTMFVAYSLPAVDAPVLGPRTLSVNAVELADGSTGVRVDATVRYSAPRLPAQQVPTRARALVITMTRSPFGQSPAPPLKSPLTITTRSEVRRIAAIVDGLPFVALNGIAMSCPAILPAPIVTFAFRSAPDGPVLATVTEASNTPTGAEPCFTADLTIRGHREPGLLEGGRLLRRAGAILGVKLTTPSLRPVSAGGPGEPGRVEHLTRRRRRRR